MATTIELISRVRSSFKLISADDAISNRAVADELRSASNKLIKQQTDKRRLTGSDNILTEISCLQMEQVPLSSCCSYTAPCNIARTVLQLPKIAENIYGPMMQVFSIDGKVEFHYSDPERYANLLKLNDKPIKKKRFFWIRGGHIYITDPLIETIRPILFSEEYFDPNDYSCSGPTTCPENPLYSEFRAPGYLLDDIVKMAREVIERDYKRSADDKTEDNNDQSK